MTPQPASESQGRTYQILETLGRGGFGTVYRAELRGLGGFTKLVALKVLNPEVVGSADITHRLRDEARILGLIRHRAIVQVDGLVQLSGRWAVVMEYVQGVDLRRALYAQGPLPIGAVLEVVGEVASALATAWSAEGTDGRRLGLLHRDIKPANLHLTRSGEVKVLDFGIARADFDGREARTSRMMYGSLPYMAPERFEALDTHKGDVYALGVTLVELATGGLWEKPEFNELAHEARLQQACASIRVRARDAQKAHVDDLCLLVRDMMAFEPDDRPEAEEVHRRCRALERWFGDSSLADVARHLVPRLLASNEPPEPGELSGSLLVEQDTGGSLVASRPGTPTPGPAARSRPGARRFAPALLGLVVALALAVAVTGVVGTGVWFATRAEEQAPPAVAVDLEPEPAPKPPPAPIEVAPAPIAPEPAPAPRPKPALAPRVRVSATGASAVALVVDGSPRPLPDSFKPGAYDVQADFGVGLVPAGRVTLPGAESATLACDAAFRLCRLQP